MECSLRKNHAEYLCDIHTQKSRTGQFHLENERAMYGSPHNAMAMYNLKRNK